VAIIHEDGAYGVDVAKGNEEGAKKGGLNVVMDEGYSISSPDLSSLVTKLKRARPDVILHTGYNPDISLFLRQARELSLRFDALIGHGAGYTDYTKIKQTVGSDANYFFDVDPMAPTSPRRGRNSASGSNSSTSCSPACPNAATSSPGPCPAASSRCAPSAAR
jgi:branched-chain amino acid transport system substrate-binding protein